MRGIRFADRARNRQEVRPFGKFHPGTSPGSSLAPPRPWGGGHLENDLAGSRVRESPPARLPDESARQARGRRFQSLARLFPPGRQAKTADREEPHRPRNAPRFL